MKSKPQPEHMTIGQLENAVAYQRKCIKETLARGDDHPEIVLRMLPTMRQDLARFQQRLAALRLTQQSRN